MQTRADVKLLLRQFSSPLILVLIVATLISIAIGDRVSGSIILGIIIPSGLLGFWQERQAGKTMDSLLARIAIRAEVIRDGKELSIPANEVLLGDVVLLRAGDLVPADCKVTESRGLLVDESVLTGESFPKEKAPNEKIFQGSHVSSGEGRATVTAIGSHTEFASVIAAATSKPIVTSFERGTTQFGKMLIYTMLSLVSSLFIINIVLHRPFIESVLFSLALSVGLTPQLLPVIISVSLSVGARKMAQEKVLVKRLDAIEDLGVMNALCTDKTGTITSGVITLDGAIAIDGAPSTRVEELSFYNASLQDGYPNPMDQAIVASLSSKYSPATRVAEIPYDFTRRRLSILVKKESNLLITKGAVKELLSISTAVRIGQASEPIDPHLAEINALFEKLSSQGNRVVAVASKEIGTQSAIAVSDESEMVLEGFLVFYDPPKEGAQEAIKELQLLGIDLYLITGDNPFAAQAISDLVGLKSDGVITGAEIAEMNSMQLAEKIGGVRIFAAMNPLQKEEVVKALQVKGLTVGYFGDGINDAPALHAADVGLTVDNGVDVAKNAASIVLLEKDLKVLANGIRLGRKTFINTLKYVRVGISAEFGNVFSMATAALFLPFLPLLPAQILLLNFTTDFPAVAISGDSVDEEAALKPQSWDIRAIRRNMIIFGLISTVFDLLTFAVLRIGFSASPELFRTGWFIESTFTELTVMLVLRTKRNFWRSRPGKGLFWSSIVCGIFAVALPFTALGQRFGFTPPPISLLAILAGLIVIYIAINERVKKRWWV